MLPKVSARDIDSPMQAASEPGYLRIRDLRERGLDPSCLSVASSAANARKVGEAEIAGGATLGP